VPGMDLAYAAPTLGRSPNQLGLVPLAIPVWAVLTAAGVTAAGVVGAAHLQRRAATEARRAAVKQAAADIAVAEILTAAPPPPPPPPPQPAIRADAASIGDEETEPNGPKWMGILLPAAAIAAALVIFGG